MKIKDLFKKREKHAANCKIEKLEKNQLEKVIGGLDSNDTTEYSTESSDSTTKPTRKSGSVIGVDR